MEIVEERQENGLLLHVSGRIDTNTSTQLQPRILNGFQKFQNIVLDLGGVDYISSAGLRVLLIGEKTAKAKGGRLRITRVQPEVWEVLRMSGFDRILDIDRDRIVREGQRPDKD